MRFRNSREKWRTGRMNWQGKSGPKMMLLPRRNMNFILNQRNCKELDAQSKIFRSPSPTKPLNGRRASKAKGLR
jgi:hypothetical protein